MFEMFTVSAKRVVAYTKDEAVQLKRDHIRPEHFLLAILREGREGAAASLKSLGIDYEMTLAAVIENRGQGKWRFRRHLPFTASTRKCLEQAFLETLNLKHDFLSTDHLLLGLLHEETSEVGRLLHHIGAPAKEVREQVLKNFVGPADHTREQTHG